MTTIIPLLLLVGIVIVVVIAIQRSMGKRSDVESDGSDLVSYLILALAMGVAGFALVELARAAFPGDEFVFEPNERLATSLSALVVATPFLVYFWRRQAQRRAIFPRSAGWTLYLALIEAVFMTAFVITAIQFLHGLFTDDSASAWTGALIFGAIVVFHELAARDTPPLSDAGELQRVIGSAIGLITTAIGLGGVLGGWLFALIYEGLAEGALDPELSPWFPMVVVGAPVWWYRWLRPWAADPGVPRLTWTVLVTTASMTLALGAGTAIGIMVLEYLFTDIAPAGTHFDALPLTLALLVVGLSVWLMHRRSLADTVRTNPLRAYEYIMAAIGLAVAISSAIALTIVAFDRNLIVGGDVGDVLGLATTLVVALVVWGWFGTRSRRGGMEEETTAWPRRIYYLGLGVLLGLVAAGALITTLFVLLRRLLNGDDSFPILEPVTIVFYSALATWYLLATYARDREKARSEEVITPYEVTIICGHPGMIATRFPKQARLRVLHRGDREGIIDDAMADEIVETVANRSSLVWVDDEGFRVAPARRG